MYRTSLRKVGGSVMLVVPPAFLEQLNVEAGTTVGLEVADGRLVVDPKPGPRYTLKSLLAASDYSQTQTEEDRDWVSSSAVGGELV